MRPTTRAQVDLGSSLHARIRRGLLFVAIVWSIAGAFLLLRVGLPELTQRLLVAGWIPSELALPDRGAPPAPIACEASPVGPAAVPPDPPLARGARFAAWQLGRDLGFAAGLANLGRTGGQLAPLLLAIGRQAAALAVPPPHLPEVRHAAYAFAAYQAFVRDDPQCVAAALARRFGEDAAHHYRFGLVVGYVVPARAQNLGALFPAELRHHGRLAGVPEPLFGPLTREVPQGSAATDPSTSILEIVDRLDGYIASRK